jgi:arylsulfatase A-like enzyme
MKIAGAPHDMWDHNAVDGMSLLGLFKNASATLDRDALYWHYPRYHAGGDAPYSAIRSGFWRLIEFLDDTPPELYNLQTDLGEQHNLAATRPEKLDELRDKLHAWRRAVGAQMPTENPNYDPAKAGKPAVARKR